MAVAMAMASTQVGGSVSVGSSLAASERVDGNFDWNSQHGRQVVVAGGM
jgi:hypothetical protein